MHRNDPGFARVLPGVDCEAVNEVMSPTVFREGPFRFFFFSREEDRPHVHVESADGEAKVWLDPQIELARRYVPVLSRRVVTGPGSRVALVDAVADHLTPPISVLAGGQVVACVATAAGRVARGTRSRRERACRLMRCWMRPSGGRRRTLRWTSCTRMTRYW